MPTETTHDDWLAERKKGIGGSDAASLFNIGWGCKRRLFYDKRSVPEDYPREENKIMALGKVLEPWFAEQYKESTGRVVIIHDRPFVHPEVTELRVNVDRSVYCGPDENEPMGVLEIKSTGRAAFYKYKREGLPEDYVLQLQHAMLVTGATWGSFCIGSRDSGELLHWDVDRNETICNEILIEGPKFWAQVENGPIPDALEPDDPRCNRCSWRKTCQGNALIQISDAEMPQAEELRPLLDEFLERKTLLAQAEELVDETGEQLRTELGDRQAVYVGDKKVYYRPQAGRTLYKGKELLEAYKKLFNFVKDALDSHNKPSDAPQVFLPPEQFIDTGKPSRPLRIF